MLAVDYSRVTGGDDKCERGAGLVIRLRDVAWEGCLGAFHRILKSATCIRVLSTLLEHAPRPKYGVEAGDETVFETWLLEHASH
ncbi:hypothetical protein AUP68_17242 [Ilyonectria robusta]